MSEQSEEGPKGTIDRAFLIVESFRPEDSAGLGVSEIARRTGLSKATTHRLLATLVRNRALEKSNETYRLGALINSAASENLQQAQMATLTEVLTPYLSALFERTRNTVHLAFLDGIDVFYANKLFAFKGPSAPSRVGGRVPGYCTGVGKAILAFDEDATVATLERGLEPWTPHTITDPEKLQRELATIRETGISYDREENTVGLVCVAAPIFGQGPIPVAAMSISGDSEVFNPEEHLDTLRKITHAASRAYVKSAQRNPMADSNLAQSATLRRAAPERK